MSITIITVTVTVIMKTVLQACPSLEHIGGVSSWGGVEREELEMMRGEVKARNLALAIL